MPADFHDKASWSNTREERRRFRRPLRDAARLERKTAGVEHAEVRATVAQIEPDRHRVR
jgi:hypothetical protein